MSSSFWKYFIDNEFMQRHDIEEMRQGMRARMRRESRRRRQIDERLEDLEVEVGEMRLFTRAVLALLQEEGLLDGARIREKLLEIDASDGTVDGQYTPDDVSDEAPAAESAAEDAAADDDAPPAPVRRRRRRG